MNRVIAITGASAGIGRAIALRTARDGSAVAICARRGPLLDKTAAGVTQADDMHRFVGGTVERFGRLDVMICNAGFGIAGAIDQVTPDQMRRLLDVNYMGTFYAAAAGLAVFRRQHSGHLIVMSSIVGKRGVPYVGAYAATKFAQVGMAECLRAELAGSPIHVTVVYPVSTDSEFFDVMSRETGTTIVRAAGPRQKAAVVADACLLYTSPSPRD